MKLTEHERQIIEIVREIVEWDRPYVNVCKRGLYISLTKNDKDDAYLSWRGVERAVINGTQQEAEARIALIEQSLMRMKRKLKSELTKES